MRVLALIAPLFMASVASLALIGCGGDDTCLTCDDAGAPDASDARANDATIDALDGGDGSADASDGDSAADARTDGDVEGGADLGRPGAAFVSSGTVCASPKYRMVVSLGQGPGGTDTSTSPKYRFNGGVVGATQKQ